MAIPCSDSRYRENGAAAVELAVVLPVLILILLGIIQFGFILNGQITLTHAAREGARLAVINGDNDQAVKQRVKDSSVALLLKLNEVVIDRPSNTDNENDRDWIKVTVSGSVSLIVPLPDKILEGGSIKLSSESIMRAEY